MGKNSKIPLFQPNIRAMSRVAQKKIVPPEYYQKQYYMMYAQHNTRSPWIFRHPTTWALSYRVFPHNISFFAMPAAVLPAQAALAVAHVDGYLAAAVEPSAAAAARFVAAVVRTAVQVSVAAPATGGLLAFQEA